MNQLLSDTSLIINLERVEEYIEENLDTVGGGVLITHYDLVDDCLVFRITIREILKEGHRTKREEQIHTISKSLLIKLGLL